MDYWTNGLYQTLNPKFLTLVRLSVGPIAG